MRFSVRPRLTSVLLAGCLFFALSAAATAVRAQTEPLLDQQPAAAGLPATPPEPTALPPAPDQPAVEPGSPIEAVRSFAADIAVKSDGLVSVTERIEYFFPEARHGIYRDIPLMYTDDQGERWRIPIEVKGVGNGEGGTWPYEVQSTDYGIRIKIGDPDRTITGNQTYEISYDARGALRYFADHDELYWNVTGDQWEVPINRVAATVTLPPGVPTDKIDITCYTGPQGSTDQHCQGNTQGPKAQFAADDFLTIVVGWPPGLVGKMEAEKVAPPLSPFFAYLLPLLVGLVLFRQWWRYGRDSAGRGTLVVQYDPPKDMTPADVGTLWDERATVKEMTATIVDLAVRGFIKIREVEKQGLLFKSKDYELEKLKDFYDPQFKLKPYETQILKTLFGLGDKVFVSSLKEAYAFQTAMSGITTAMYDGMVSGGYFEANPEKVRAKYIGVGTVILFVDLMFGAGFVAAIDPAWGLHGGVAAGVCGALFIIFGFVMPKKTAAGVAAKEHATGFREYLDRAEKYRLQWQEKENIFETFLPYAMVFGVADKWAKAFEGMEMKPPQWYEGRAFSAGVFNAAAFSSTFGSLNSAVNSAVLSRPQQSSHGSGFSSGGGFSGGGGGGGGGGSW